MRIVQKYGGTSLADKDRIFRAAGRAAALARQGKEVVVVVSAQGDTTDDLMQKAEQICPAPDLREMDALISAGEQMSAALMAMAVGELGVPAVSLTGWQAGIRTDGNHGDARIRRIGTERIESELTAGKVVVIAGFQGIGPDESITTLGRGGSDTTAVALAVWLGADVCQIFTDVDGVYDRDPGKHSDAVRYDRISYDEMLALARSGAQVLHDRCVDLAREHKLSLQVRSAFKDGPGTVVG